MDHPRIRGEHPDRSGSSRPAPGSSPHTRGARYPFVLREASWRIIPAYAGSTVPGRGNPHEKRGSSPHTRGAPVVDVDLLHRVRIIPAYAGSTSSSQTFVPHSVDHPRIRGEHIRGMSVKELKSGSSPHTRGAHPSAVRRCPHRRIIPAYAGSTRPSRVFMAA